jgi:hypothetical protein
VRSQQRPAPGASAGDLRAFDQLAQQQIAVQLLQTAMILMVCVASFAGSGGQSLLVGEAATVSGSMQVAPWPMGAGSLAAGRARR